MKPHWIPINKLTFYGHKLFMRDASGKFVAACLPELCGDETSKNYVKYTWPWPSIQPTHYWSF